MDFLTTEYIAERAKLGEIPALKCSLKHHQQGRDADWVELRDAMEKRRFGTGSIFCAICTTCDKCPLAENGRGESERCCGGLWEYVDKAFTTLKADYSNANFKAFQEAEGKLCTYIEGVLERKRAEKDVSCLKSCCKHYFVGSIADNPCRNCSSGSNFKSKSTKESKPALRHGDYGEDGHLTHSPLFVVVMKTKIGKDVPLEFVYGDGSRCSVDDRNITWHGNFIDDLALRAEDLDNYETSTKFNGDERKLNIGVAVNPGDLIYFNIKVDGTYVGHQVHANIAEATEIHQKLGQMIATVRRKQGKKQENE